MKRNTFRDFDLSELIPTCKATAACGPNFSNFALLLGLCSLLCCLLDPNCPLGCWSCLHLKISLTLQKAHFNLLTKVITKFSTGWLIEFPVLARLVSSHLFRAGFCSIGRAKRDWHVSFLCSRLCCYCSLKLNNQMSNCRTLPRKSNLPLPSLHHGHS